MELTTIIDSYGWQGIALVAMLLLLLLIQIYYYSWRFMPLGKYLIKTRPQLHATPPAVSVVIPMFTEDYDYLDNTLPLILGQEAAEFEIVIVYVGCDNDFYDDMVRLKEIFHNVTITKIERNERFPISVKTALNVGIKAAHFEHILFSTTDARPTSEKWISLMARGFQRGDVVLGYCAVERDDDKLDSYFIRVTRLVESMFWLSQAISGKPYRAIRSNMGFTRSLYFKVNGFNRLNMNIGEDDLFMQTIMTSENVSVILAPRATVLQRCWGRLGGMIDRKWYYGSAERFYPVAARNFLRWEFASRTLFFLLSIVGLIFLPLELKAFVLLLILLRLLSLLIGVKKVADRVGESSIVGRYVIYDILSPIFTLFMRVKMLRKDKRVWR